MNKNQTERGQVLIIIILASVVIFGFVALAVDMGQVLSNRRSAQNAADSAALSAAYDALSGSKDAATAIANAYALAAENGFDNNQVDNWVVVRNGPISDGVCWTCEMGSSAKEYYQVVITVKMKPIFAQFFYKGAEQTTVEAIAHARNADGLSAGDAILSLSKEDDSLDLSGNVTVYVDGGNIRSNGGMVKNGASGGVTVKSGKIYYASGFKGSTGPLSPAPKQGAEAALLGGWPEPWCPTASGTADWTSGSGYKTKKIDGVNYYYYASGLSVENLLPGIHCIEGGIGKGNYVGKDILIVLLSGGIQQTGNDSVNLQAASSLIDANGNEWGGMVFYAPSSNTSTMKFGGNSGAYFYGTVYAPGAACDIGGTEDGSAEHTAFICNTFKFHGNPVTNIKYNPAELFHFPPMIELQQ
jgi:hypothetical protein